MAGFRLIDLAKPFLPILPEVEIPYEKISFDDKMVYTIFTGLIYLFAQFPLAGLRKDDVPAVNDPLYFLRGVFAAEPRTILEFGLLPIFASGIILQLLAGLKVIKVNFKVKADRELFQSLTKLFSIFQYFVLANIFIFSGYYGSNLSIAQMVVINIQLVMGGLFACLLTEVIDKGFGLGAGAMIINTIAVSTNLVSDTLGVAQITVDAEGNNEAQGALVNLIQGLRAKHRTLFGGIISAFNRDYLPNMTTTFLVIALGGFVCYLQNYRYEIAIRSTRARGTNQMYPIQLIYTGCLSVIFSYVCLFYIHIGAFILIQIIAKNNQENIICKVLGHYENVNNIIAAPTFPLSMLTPPRSLVGGITEQPLSFVVYTLFMVSTGVWFATKWQAISGRSARDIARDFKEQSITLLGRREQNMAKELGKVIPTAATTGAAILAIVAVAGELLGLKGKGAGMVVGVSGGFSLLEIVSLDFQQNGGESNLGNILQAGMGF
ncbi:similar to Saccharomyces cerevisiae YBR283C SSH1 Subunit of the Ssh1 translocon complex [Maudiozyma barnettii]|uniref:Similar to Saccharomyces cerevisiae YBR283C SSH1 Subunit of the Ssh1 translocon complex n=1 Tax=Maudiozyma barnettii TaxID=61262 RepID=A0A8H2VG17_9SACH|nr:Ssh1p [Kazachstania barnettii]CAB4254563.1 similar to Saccharomyces cerevisiae YBR283C SSH1 Subunit of the Ssh1 translocon complex [Kazachstania barnettii]CAD1782605.1 similar to Saccharomyces cerevisiae YBR283C SSH1 Subunit of the Ssh1 translocon complex [Kazachstania barnettii]